LVTGFARRNYLQDLRLVRNGIDRLGSGKEGIKEKRKEGKKGKNVVLPKGRYEGRMA
jgi:hypothetical protein